MASGGFSSIHNPCAWTACTSYLCVTHFDSKLVCADNNACRQCVRGRENRYVWIKLHTHLSSVRLLLFVLSFFCCSFRYSHAPPEPGTGASSSRRRADARQNEWPLRVTRNKRLSCLRTRKNVRWSWHWLGDGRQDLLTGPEKWSVSTVVELESIERKLLRNIGLDLSVSQNTYIVTSYDFVFLQPQMSHQLRHWNWNFYTSEQFCPLKDNPSHCPRMQRKPLPGASH